MTENEKELDKRLSANEYVTYYDIAADLVKDKSNECELQKISDSLRNIVSRQLKKEDVIDYKNGKDAKDGLKYKSGYEHHLRFLEDVKIMESLSGSKKKSFATIGLGLLLDEGSKELTRIEFECVRNLTNAGLIKEMAGYILRENVLRFTYMTNGQEKREITFHPQYLKEYNNRWAVYGKSEGTDHYPTCVKIDSIMFGSLKTVPKEEIKYQNAERHFYRDYFKDFIGFTRKRNDKVQNIYIVTNTKIVHTLIKTKPFHESQVEMEGWSEEKQHGKFVLHVIPNIELRTKLLSYGSGITLEGNGWFQRDFKEEIRKMAELYQEAVRDK